MSLLKQYIPVVGEDVIRHLYQLAEPLKGVNVLHINSTREGGGVAEILHRLVPLNQDLGLNAEWDVVTGDGDYFQCTKKMHNGLQGNQEPISNALLRHYEKINAENYERLEHKLSNADIVFIHDPQPVMLHRLCANRRGKWIWRCHIDASRPFRPTWRYLSRFVSGYDASIYSLPAFARTMNHPLYIIPPSIDPLSEKNIQLDDDEINSLYDKYNIDPTRPVISQISRFDRFKDPVGVIQAYRMVRSFGPSLQLILAGGAATDDPEGAEVLEEVQKAAADDPDIHILLLPPDAHRTINGIQRISDIVLQKSLKEGFGLTVTEAMWKEKPIIGGNVGGIRIQVANHHTGFLVDTPEGAALRIRYLLNHRDHLLRMGKTARNFVLENYLLTRHLKEYLTMMLAVIRGSVGMEVKIDISNP
jgi:trehalose synthase